MSRIVFVYAGSPDSDSRQSPYTITRNLYHFLNNKIPTVYHEWSSNGPVDIQPDDIILCHPNYPENSVAQWIFRNAQCRAKCLIHPLHTRYVNDNIPFDWMARKADAIFSIAGPFWIDTIGQTPFAHWAPKITRLDMAVDTNVWTHRKKTFNPPGKRGVVYVGSSIPNKNLGQLVQIAQKLPNVKFQWYGGSSDHPLFSLPNCYVEGWVHFSEEKIKSICEQNDIVISVSESDANPTTLTEWGLASGLIPVCTQESGYWHDPCFANIPLNDIDGSIKVINEWLAKPSSELEERSLLNRKSCEEKYTWDVFCSKVWNKLKEYL